jgi:hypothetical protein
MLKPADCEYKLTRDKTIKGSKYGGNKVEDNKSYHSNRYKSDFGLMPKFTHTRESENLTTYSDEDYLYITTRYCTGTTAAYLADGCLEAINTGHMTGNMKDVVANQQTGFDNLVTNIMPVLFDLAFQQTIRKVLDNPPEQNTNNLDVSDGAIGNVKVPIYTPDEFNTVVANMEGRNLIIPDVCLKILKLFNWYVKRSDEYFIGTSTIPSSYWMPFIGYYTPDNLDTIINTVYTNLGQAKLHMDKFGVKYSKFSIGMLDSVEKDMRKLDDDLIAWFCHAYPEIYDGANPQSLRKYSFSADNSENHRYYFRNSPNDSDIHAYAKLLDEYNATYNQYGGLLSTIVVPTTQGYVDALYCDKAEDTGFKGNSAAGFFHLIRKYYGVYKQTNTFNISTTGTYLAADVDISTWPTAIDFDLKHGSGLNETKTDNILINALIRDMF